MVINGNTNMKINNDGSADLRINCRGNKGQEEAVKWWFGLDSKYENVTEMLWCSGRGGGKSFIGLTLLTVSALVYPNTMYAAVRASLTALRRYTIPTIMDVFRSLNITDKDYRMNLQDNYIVFNNGSRIYLVEASYQPSDCLYTRLASSFFTSIFIEEANEIELKAKNQLCASTGRCKNDEYGFKGKVLMVCNPDPNSYLYSQFYKPYVEGTLEPFRCYLFSSPRDNKMLPKDYIPNLERTLTFADRQRLVNGVWNYFEDENNLVSFQDIEDCFTNTPNSGTKRISVDMSGGTGRDSSIGVYWEGTEATIFLNTNIGNAKEIEEAIRNKAAEKQVGYSNIVYDADGVGKYLGSYLPNAVEFHNNGRPFDSSYTNLKSECAFKLAELINNHSLRINCSDEALRNRIKDELMMLKKKNNDEQKRQLISKDEMKKISGGKSPDTLDSLIYGMYGLIKAPSRGIKRVDLGCL